MTGKLFIVKKEIQDWCLKHRVDYKHMIDAAIVIGVASDVKEKFNVGRGTKLSAGQHRCVCIDMLKLENIGADAPKLVAQRAVKIEGSQAANN